MKKSLIILGSSRSQGHTRKIVDYYRSISESDLVDLNCFSIGFYDYNFGNQSDDFMKLVPEILKYETLIFATPIYWYTMSAQMKTFFDRLSDLLVGKNKPLGRQLRGKRMGLISCGSDDELFEGFQMPFEQSANYLGMSYRGHVHTWIEADGSISSPTKKRLEEFAQLISNK